MPGPGGQQAAGEGYDDAEGGLREASEGLRGSEQMGNYGNLVDHSSMSGQGNLNRKKVWEKREPPPEGRIPLPQV